MTIRQYKIKEWSRFSWDIQEALVKKYDVILTDYKERLTKRELGIKIGMAIYSQLSKKNLQSGIGMIQKTTDMISQFGKAFENSGPQNKRRSYSNKDVKSAFWGNESKESKRDTRKETMSFYGEKIPFSSSKKIGF